MLSILIKLTNCLFENEEETENFVKENLLKYWKRNDFLKNDESQKLFEITERTELFGDPSLFNKSEVVKSLKSFIDKWNVEFQERPLNRKQLLIFALLIKTVLILYERVSLNLYNFLVELKPNGLKMLFPNPGTLF
ncbi:hypothetical protein CDIK_2084 [Cucumispora dikerogammari]|nr:hypothetical protein CDIK_2084 [Cucumispora dikerogammari]